MDRITKIERGFTMMELMITLGIIAVLSAIIIPSVLKSRAQSNLTACEENLHTIASAEVVYFSTHNHYATMEELVDSECLKDNVTCPASGKAYTIEGNNVEGVGMMVYTISCNGNHTATMDLPSGYPKYSQIYGKILREAPAEGGS